MIETLQDRLVRHEGYRSFPYKDILGHWTIGIGHLITADQASNEYLAGISYQEAMNLLEADIAKCTDQADTQITCFEDLNSVRQDVIIEMIFQLGINGVLAFHNMMTAIKISDWQTASDEMLNSEWNKQTPERCQELSGLMLNGVV